MATPTKAETQARLRKEEAERDATMAKQKADRETAQAEQLELFKSEIADNDRSMRAATEYLLKAVDLGATQRRAADEVGKSESWVNRLLKWGRGGFKDTGPFSTDAKTKRDRTAKNIRRLKKTAEERPGIGHNNPPPDEPARVNGSASEMNHEAAKARQEAPAGEETPAPAADKSIPSTAKSSAINAADIALDGFTVHVLDLIRRIAKHQPQRFAGTAVPGDELLKLGEFLTELGRMKSSEATSKVLQ